MDTSPLSDIQGSRYEHAISELDKRRIVSGYPDRTFKPDNPINRAELVAILIRAAYSDAMANKSAKRISSTLTYPSLNAGNRRSSWLVPSLMIDLAIVSGYAERFVPCRK